MTTLTNQSFLQGARIPWPMNGQAFHSMLFPQTLCYRRYSEKSGNDGTSFFSPDLPWPPEFPASVLETIYALSVSCVSVSPRSQSSCPPWRAPALSAPLWRSFALSALHWWASVSSAPPWWAPVSSALPWWAPVSSAQPWWAPVPPWGAPVPPAVPWWAPIPSVPTRWAPFPSALPRWAPVPSAPTWYSALPAWRRILVLALPHGPGPSSLPRFHPRSTATVGGSTALSRIWLPFHHMDSCTTLTVAHHLRLQFPSFTALKTQYIHPADCINHTADCTDHTAYLSHGLPLCHR